MNLEYHYATIPQLHQAFREKKLTVRKLVLLFLSRIAEIDQSEKGLHSVLEINPDVLFIADSLDQKLQAGEALGPLFGIPILLKDNINTADRMHTSAGSLALQNNYAPYDAFIVKKLRQAGAVILGKANMTEFANFITDGEMPDGYSSRGGQVFNPYNRDKTPSGSSSGSAVAVAAGLCTAAIGTETCGSIVNPAGQNGIVGIKPTLGLVGRSGIIPIAGSFDTAGPMTRTVEDAAILLSVIAGIDPDDPATQALAQIQIQMQAQTQVNFTSTLKNNGLQGVRIGIYRPKTKEDAITEEGRERFGALCQMLTEAGAILIDPIEIKLHFNMWKMTRNEFKSSINYYLSSLNGSAGVKTLGEIIAYNEAHAERALKYGQSTFLEVENKSSGTMTEPEYLQALAEREAAITSFDQVFSTYNIDLILCETFNTIAAPFTGFPSMIIPIGQRQDKLPMDCYWMARRYEEATLLRVTYAVEQELNVHLKPDLREICDASKVLPIRLLAKRDFEIHSAALQVEM